MFLLLSIFSYPVFPRPSRQVLCGHNQVHNPLSSLYRSNNKPWVSCQPGFEVHLRELRLIIMITHQHVPFKEKELQKQFAKRSPREKTFRILSHFKREVETPITLHLNVACHRTSNSPQSLREVNPLFWQLAHSPHCPPKAPSSSPPIHLQVLAGGRPRWASTPHWKAFRKTLETFET